MRNHVFIVARYLRALTELARSPKCFFSSSDLMGGWRHGALFLGGTSVAFTMGAISTQAYPQTWMMALILFANATGMTLIAAVFGFVVMSLSLGRKANFGRVFNVYAFASGTVLLAAWVPFFIVLTEPWRWWMISSGLVNGCGFSRGQAVWIIGASLCLIVGGFYSLTTGLSAS